MELSLLTSLPGVVQAALADDSGRLLDHTGEMEPPTAAILVLAHATLAAAAELGRRSGNGDCIEIVQQHEAGVIYLHSISHRRVLLVRCSQQDSIPAVRNACQRLAVPTDLVPKSTFVPQNIASALHAEPAW